MSQVKHLNKSTLKRLKQDMKLLKKYPSKYIHAIPDESNILVWYFLIIGPDDSQYKDGHFIGKIMHHKEYPQKPPDYMMLTPNGRFLTDKKICITNSGYHSDLWSPSWSITALLQGFLSVFLADDDNGISHIKQTKEQRHSHSIKSIDFNEDNYKKIYDRFSTFINISSSKES